MDLPGYKDIIELIKAGATIEAQERIMELRKGALELQEENMRLRHQVSELTARVRELESADGEPCPRCRKRSWIVESSAPDSLLGVAGVSRRNYRCTECGFKESVLQTAK